MLAGPSPVRAGSHGQLSQASSTTVTQLCGRRRNNRPPSFAGCAAMSSFDSSTDFPAKAAVNAPHHPRGSLLTGRFPYQADLPRGTGHPWACIARRAAYRAARKSKTGVGPAPLKAVSRPSLKCERQKHESPGGRALGAESCSVSGRKPHRFSKLGREQALGRRSCLYFKRPLNSSEPSRYSAISAYSDCRLALPAQDGSVGDSFVLRSSINQGKSAGSGSL